MVATVLTVYGIETVNIIFRECNTFNTLQQYLPFTVLKLKRSFSYNLATVCTVATVLTVYGIETMLYHRQSKNTQLYVATVLTVYGIETVTISPVN